MDPNDAHGFAAVDKRTTPEFLATVGDRVRNVRRRKGISRRALSEMSGVSPRYLAQLESGKGNISIALLLKVSNALGFGVEWLVSKDDPWNSDGARVRFLLANVTEEQRSEMFELLELRSPRDAKANRVALIGLRGAGKSTLGRLVSSRLEMPFLELDDEIEQAGGMPVGEVFSLYGQDGYRRLERQSLEHITSVHDTLVLAVAGGIVSDSQSFNYLLGNYHTIWLRAEPEDHMTRVRKQGDERPMEGNPDAMKDLRNILASREMLYAKADAQIDTSATDTPEDALQMLLEIITANGFVGQRG